MGKKRKPIENLAREICWVGFSSPEGRAGKTKAKYWESLPYETHQRYIQDAEWFAWILHRVPVEALNALSPACGKFPVEPTTTKGISRG